MTNNPTIDGVSRELLETLVKPIRSALDESKRLDARKELRALLDAPVGELHPVHEHDCCANCMRPRMEHCGENCPAPETTVWHAWDYGFAPNTKVPPELAALQSTIAQLQARIGELESGRGEPVAELLVEFFEHGPRATINWFTPSAFEHGATKVFTAPPAPVAAQDPDIIHDAAFRNGVMHGYMLGSEGSEEHYQKCISRLTDALNAARRERRLDATDALNGVKS